MTVDEDALVVKQTLTTGQRRRLRWEPRTDGQWDYYEDELHDGEWQPVGHEIVEDVDVERGAEVLPA